MTLGLAPAGLAVRSIRNPSEARLLYEPMRREILRLLGKAPMTQTQLASSLGLQTPTVGYHLSALKESGFVAVVRESTGKHGIVEKYHAPTAQFYCIDRKIMPLDIRRYYMPLDIERARGILACAKMEKENFNPTSDLMENLAEALCDSISRVARRYETPASKKDPEAFIGRLYCEALEDVLKTPSFKELRSTFSLR